MSLEIRDANGDSEAVDEAARSLHRDKFDLLYVVARAGDRSDYIAERAGAGR